MSNPYENPNDDQWLLRHAADIHSQSGEDGILQKVFEVIQPANRWCVEFGAWDGKTYSNTHHLMRDAGWRGVFIEADPVRFRDLIATYSGNPSANCLNCFVNFEGENSLDNLLGRAGIPKDFDLLSIDIDGNDYHVWESLNDHQPRVVVIEFNPTIPNEVEFVQARDMSVRQGCAPLSLIKLGKRKGYEPVCITQLNIIFVRIELFKLFKIANNDIARLCPAGQPQFHLFQLYDGTFIVGGSKDVFWHGVPILPGKLQVLPKMFRVFPVESMNFGKRLLWRLWRFLYNRGMA